jgi:hypothetical protein
MPDGTDPLVRRTRRLCIEAQDWSRAVDDTYNQGTHRPERAINGRPEAWDNV